MGVEAGGFEAWYRTEHPRLLAAMTLVGGCVEPAREAVDEALARALERWPSVSAMTSPGGWTYKWRSTACGDRSGGGRRAMVALRYVADLSQADIAEVLGVTRSTVSSSLTDAHRALGHVLADDDWTEEAG